MSGPEFIVVGAGIAGLRAAVELGRGERPGTVVVVTKAGFDDSATAYAQGGIAAALGEGDTVAGHEEDTLRAGGGLCEPAAVRLLVREAPQAIAELLAWGAAFDAREPGATATRIEDLAFAREGAHSRSRVLHARGDATGREIALTLLRRARAMPQIEFRPRSMATRLLRDAHGRITGVECRGAEGASQTLAARAVLLATGGLGQVFAETTNPEVATGDGLALAAAAGAWLADLEFVQFHPTALALPGAPRFLLSEALRGEGAVVRNAAGERFLAGYDPRAELAPRDIVARAIEFEIARPAARPPGAPAVCYLDATHLDGGELERRFPHIVATLRGFGLELSSQWIPIRPAAHYAMGGVWTDLEGRTSLAGLFAAGEVAANGVHGANRLASNSLLEGLVFGARAARAMRGEVAPGGASPAVAVAPLPARAWSRARLQAGMSRAAGVLRQGAALNHWLGELRAQAPAARPAACCAEIENANLAAVAAAITAAALARDESRGAHFRADYPGPRADLAGIHSWQRAGEPPLLAPRLPGVVAKG